MAYHRARNPDSRAARLHRHLEEVFLCLHWTLCEAPLRTTYIGHHLPISLPGHHAWGTDETCCAGGFYQTSRGTHAPKCNSIFDVVASDRRLTSLAQTLRTTHFSGILSAVLQARDHSSGYDVHIICHNSYTALPHFNICADCYILHQSALRPSAFNLRKQAVPCMPPSLSCAISGQAPNIICQSVQLIASHQAKSGMMGWGPRQTVQKTSHNQAR